MTHTLAYGRDPDGVNRPFHVNGDGTLNTAGTSADPNIPQPERLLYGRTAAGVNVPISVDTSGNVTIA